MPNQNALSTLLVTWFAVPSLGMFLGAAPARAQSSSANYTFLVAAGFLCDSGDSAACPAVVQSANGDSYQMSGAGTFKTQSKPVTAAGTFAHKSADGMLLETGVWIASELVSFDSYGIAPGALRNGGRAVGPSKFGPMRMQMFSGSMPAGGRAVFRIRLLPVRGLPKNATLEVNCALGKAPPEHQVEGLRLAFDGGSVEFDEEVSGVALFLLTRQGAGAAAKAPTPEVETKAAPTEVQQ
ncbi:MAG TPA: hypothetical protein VMT86_02435 [Bryobacteraceae bacterium]|nr:hypothetical protein [Bryobacteraceae bacterium]